MSNYTKILSQFTRMGYTENTTLNEADLKRVLDDICYKNANIREFDPEVAEELWSECDKNPDGTVTLINFINIVSKAHGVLKDNITKCESEIVSGNIDPERRRELEEGLVQYTSDLKLLTVPFQIPAAPESKVFRDSRQSVERSRVSQGGNQNGLEASGLFSGRASGIFADVPSARENSSSLKITFVITVALFILELIIMFHKNHFYNALVYISIFAIVLLGYFDKYYMKFILVNLAVSIVFDFLWVILQATVCPHLCSHTGIPILPRITPPSRRPSSGLCISSSSFSCSPR